MSGAVDHIHTPDLVVEGECSLLGCPIDAAAEVLEGSTDGFRAFPLCALHFTVLTVLSEVFGADQRDAYVALFFALADVDAAADLMAACGVPRDEIQAVRDALAVRP